MGTAISDKHHTTKDNTAHRALDGVDPDQYVVWCPSSSLDAVANNAIRAMYYLPSQFVLMLPHTSVSEEMASMLPIADRIRIYQTNNSSSDELLHIAQAVISDDSSAQGTTLPSVTVTSGVVGVTPTARGYVSTLAPEAIATALLKLSRAAA